MMKKKTVKRNMRPENRTFEPVRFGQILRNMQMCTLACMLLAWLALREAPDFSAVMLDPLGTAVKLCLFAVAVWLLSALREGAKYLGFCLFTGVKREYLHFGIFWSRGGAVSARCMAAVDVSGYRKAVLLPCLLLGWLPWVITLVWGDLWCYSAFAILAAGTWGDLRILWNLRNLPQGSWVQDSPFAPGCDVYIPEG